MKIVILGFGNMGSWIAKELSKEHEVAVYDIDKTKTKDCEEKYGLEVIDRVGDIKKFNPEILINAVNINNTIDAFKSVVGIIPKNCILCDITSIKTGLEKFYKDSGFEFVSVHPMFGPTFANVELLQDENAVIISESCEKGKEFFRVFFEKLGLKIYEYSFKEHDEKMAYSLTLPFTATMVFASCVDLRTVPGTTFKKHMKIAKGLLSEDNQLLYEILFNPYSIEQLRKITAKLEFLKHVIKGRDFDEARKVFNKLRENIGIETK